MALNDPSIVANEYKEGKTMAEPLKTIDKGQLDELMAGVKGFMDGVKVVIGDKDLWMFTGAFFVNFVGPGILTVDQAAKIDKIKAILEKEGEMSYGDAGTMLGIISSLLSPAITDILEKQAPGVLNVIGLLTRLGGVL